MRFSRTQRLIGKDAVERLNSASVAVFGVGGVGGYIVEALARSGVGNITLIDKDVVDESNINRQIIALSSTVGQSKTQLMKNRIADINPSATVTALDLFYLPETADEIDLSAFDYVVDAIDNVTAKIELISRCKSAGVTVISAMGAGNKLDPTQIKIADISKTSVCPLARVVRRETAKRGVKDFKVAYSTELPVLSDGERAPASMICVPAVMGLIMASEIIKDLTK